MGLVELFSEIAAAIREREGSTGKVNAASFPARIRALPRSSGIELKALRIVTQPTKKTYSGNCFAAEAFAPAGMTMQATVGDGSKSFTFPVTTGQVSFSPSGGLRAGTKTVTAKFVLGGWSVSATQAVTVSHRTPTWTELERECASWAKLEACAATWRAMEA